MRTYINRKNAGIILTILFMLSLLPVVALSFYASPSADDYSYGDTTAAAVQNGSFSDVLSVVAASTRKSYLEWQGSFAAVFLMNLQPAVFGPEYYFVTTFIMLGSLIIGTALFLRELLVKYLHADVWQYCLVTAVILTMTIHFCYDPVESFYWYNGSIYYTFFYGLALILAAAVLCALRVEKVGMKVFLTVLSSVLCAVIGGGNYTTALSVMLILVFSAALLVLKKDKRALILLAVLAAGMATFMISVLSPGNGVRQEAAQSGTSPVTAILLSFVLGGYIFCNSLSLPVLIGFAAITPVLFALAKKTAYSCDHPFWFSLISVGIFCAQCTPPIYGLGIAVPERLLNIIYFSFYIFILLNMIVWSGYIAERYNTESAEKLFSAIGEHSTLIFASTVILFSALAVGNCTIGKGEDGETEILALPLGAEAAYELVSGEAADFREENRVRIELLENGEGEDVVLQSYSARPYLLFADDITTNPADWRNKALAGYYHCSSVVVEED